jgi:hypothetical protein
MELPIACSLSEVELQERRKTLLDFLRGEAVKIMPLPLGYAYTFEPSSDVVTHLNRLLDLERQCCPFLSFKMVAGAGQPIRLEVTGPPEAKTLIANLLGS